jgi:hypothetical protein
MPRAARPRLAPADALKREIQAVLRADDGSLRNERYAGGPGRFDGYGYVAAEAYFHIAGGRDAALRPMQLNHRGQSRWWLEDEQGLVIDLALGRGEKPDFPYERGAARPFRGTKAGISRGAQAIVDAVLAARG